ncbi:hypothetical protein [Raoultella terrigena]|uniref:hypothetical protein n=1 Tax=Raoultella terrigena TaxID=577 RepID=UPI001F51F3C7|nr:hypothetical protein [Raoultella terrigena]MCI1030786.1 hypothetical protein [Raoultella terrigena]
MKTILILSHTRGTSDFKIGSHHYANGFSEIGWDVYFLGVPYTFMHKVLNKSKSGVRQLNKEVKEFNVAFTFPITGVYKPLLKNVNKACEKLIRKRKVYKDLEFDIILCDYPFFVDYLDLFKYKKLVYRPTDNYISMSGDQVVRFEEKIISMSDYIVPTSDLISDELVKRYNINESKIKAISNGFDDRMFMDELAEDKNGTVYIGAIDYRLDIETIIFLAETFPEDKFDIYGPVSQDFSKKIEEAEKKCSNLKFHGKIDYSKTSEIYKKAKIGLLPLNGHESNISRSPMKLWEYASSGLNILYSQVYVKNKQQYGFLYKYDSQNLIDCYRAAKDTPFPLNERELMRLHTWKYKVKELEDIIVKL